MRRLVLALWLLLLLLLPSAAAFPAHSLEALASPYLFSLPRWEVQQLWQEAIRGLSRPGREEAERPGVQEYFRLSQEIASLGAGEPGAEEQRTALRQQRRAQERQVKAILARQLRQALAQAGVSLFPPLVFAFDAPPLILAISPRHHIELKRTFLLEPGLSLKKAEALEREVERRGDSALVEELGGVATYPSLVPETASLDAALQSIVHEWVHQYLFFRPLGRKYGSSYEMTTINETVADMVGREIANKVLQGYGLRLEEPRPREPGAFDFNREMRQTRLTVDEMLAGGQVREAETYMEERRLYLAQNGYHLRRLNQAYFAFHGSYAERPASSSPVGDLLRRIRQHYTSLGPFLNEIANLSSFQELERLATLDSP